MYGTYAIVTRRESGMGEILEPSGVGVDLLIEAAERLAVKYCSTAELPEFLASDYESVAIERVGVIPSGVL